MISLGAKRTSARAYPTSLVHVAGHHAHRRARLARGAVIAAMLLAGACSLNFPQQPGRVIGIGPLVPPPETLPEHEVAGAEALLGGDAFSLSNPDTNWGLGYLAVRSGRMEDADIPLFLEPGETHWGWLTQGRAYAISTDSVTPPRADAWLRLVDGDQALVVTARTTDGWLQVRWGQPGDFRSGLAWTRRDLIRQQRTLLVPWSLEFEQRGGLVFRDRNTQYNLRAQPGVEGEILGAIQGGDYDMEALEQAGDWLRVRVQEPARCAPPADGAGSGELLLGGPDRGDVAAVGAPTGPAQVRTGWVRWRDTRKGPWIARAWPCLRGVVG